MPKVYLTEREQSCARLSSWTYGQMKIRKIPQAHMANRLGISQQALSKKLRSNSFSYSDFLEIVKELKPSAEELHYIIGI